MAFDVENGADAALDPLNKPATITGNKQSTSSTHQAIPGKTPGMVSQSMGAAPASNGSPATAANGVAPMAAGNNSGAGAVAPDFPKDELDPDSVAFSQQQQELVQARLQLFAEMLTKRRTQAVQARAASGVERRWLDDLDAYHGRDVANRSGLIEGIRDGQAQPAKQSAKPGQAGKRSTVFVQLTRQKTNTAAARAADMLFPTDDKNWGIKPTPVPELMQELQAGMKGTSQPYQDPQTGGTLPNPAAQANPDGSQPPITLADLAAEQMALARQASAAMEKEIDDQLTECSYNAEGRKVIADAAKMGTGIIKGPAVVNRIAKKWTKKTDPATGKSVQMMQVMEVIKPQSYRVDPWNFYPDPSCGENIQDGAYVFEREYLAGRELAKLAKVPGYNGWALAQCLQEGPQHVYQTGDGYEQQRSGDLAYGRNSAYDDTRYEVWTYTGDIARDDLDTVGIQLPDTTEGWLTSFSCVIVMVNNRVVKAMLNPMDSGDFPYDVFVWERVALSPFGVGIPFLMRYAQRTLNAAWRAMLDNMALSSGPQIVMNKKAISPADGQWELTARKLWFMESGDDVQKAFWSFEITSHQAELEAIIKLAQQFADEETALPQLAQGELGKTPDTVGGMSMLMNAANTVLRRIVKQFDDQITSPHIRRYYDWNMQYNEKEEIKGDFECSARGSTALIVRDQEQQGVMYIAKMVEDPSWGVYFDKQKFLKKLLELQHVPADDVMGTPEEIQAALAALAKQQPPQDPRIQAAQISAQSNQSIAQVRAQAEQQYVQTQQQIARDDHAAQMDLAMIKRELAMLQMANTQGISLMQIKAELAQTAMQLNSQHSFKHSEMMTRANQQTGPADAATPQVTADQEM